MTSDLADILDRMRLGPIERRVAELLAHRLERWTTSSHLVEAAWEDDPNGGPDNPENCLKSVCHILRRKLEPHGLTIEGVAYYGRRMIRR